MSAAATAPAEPAAPEAPPPSTPAPAPAGSVVWSTAEPPPPADVTAAGRSVYELFLSGAAKDRDAPALGFRAPAPAAPGPYAWLSYGEVGDTVLAAAASLLADTALAPGDRVGIYGKNAPSWIVALLAISAAGMVAVPLYDSLGVGAVQYVCNHSAVKAAFVAEEQLPVFAESWPEAPTVARVIAFGPAGVAAPAPALPPAAAADPRVVTLAAFVAAAPVPLPDLPGPDVDADFVCLYTSGTTGEPKGVVITNRALVSSVSGGLAWLEHHKISLTADDCVFSFLPLAHIFAIQAETNMLSVGGSIAYYRGDIKLLLEDLLEARPTVFAGVPRVYARFQQRIRAAVAAFSPLKRALFHYAYASQLHNVRHGRPRTAIWDALVFNKVRAGLLPRGRIIVTGSAPLSAETSEFLRVCLNAPVLQGYGASETLGGVTCETPSVRGGSCGPPLPGVEIKLVDIPEMGYLTTDAPHPRGEVCVRGPMLMSGYYKRDAATAAAFDGDGFFHTGDVGMRLPDGSLAIIDRLKSLFKLSQGEYVSPEAIENELAKAELVGQIFVYGNSLESTLLAVVVLDIPAASAWAVENAPGVQGIRAIAALPALKAKVLEQLAGEAATARLKRYEYIKDILIEAADYNELGQGWHTGNQLMTPSFKLRRPQLTQKYKERLDLRYAAMS